MSPLINQPYPTDSFTPNVIVEDIIIQVATAYNCSCWPESGWGQDENIHCV